MNKWLGLGLVVLSGLVLTACGSQGPTRNFTKGDELAYYDFSPSSSFEEGSYGSTTLLIRDGKYRIDVPEGDNELWWGQWGDIYKDVVIDVNVDQLSERNENAYGIMCRVRGRVGLPVEMTAQTESQEAAALEEAAEAAETETAKSATEEADAAVTEAAAETATPEATDTATEDATEQATEQATAEAAETETATDEAPESATEDATEAATEAATPRARPTEESTPEATEVAGTALEANNGDGYLFLIQGSGAYGIFRSRGRDLRPLVDWQTSPAINVGPASNRLRAVCVGNYLALYVNDQFVASATDDTYTEGQVGLVASAANRLGVRVEFDDLIVSTAKAE